MFGALVMGISTSTAMFCGGRAFMGFGVSFALVTAPPLLQEIAHPRLRAQIGGFCKSI
jgi:MFS family permease